MKVFVTDNDGVIFDRMPVYRKVFKGIAGEYGADPEEAARYYYDSAGDPIDEQFAEIFRRSGLEVSVYEVAETVVPRFFHLASRTEAALFPEAARTLVRIRELGFHIFVTSGSNTDDLVRLWNRHGLPFDMILGSSEVKKGDRHIVLFAETAGSDIADFCQGAYLLGDGKSDMKLAKRNGMWAIGITNTLSAETLYAGGADRVISRIEEVLDFLH